VTAARVAVVGSCNIDLVARGAALPRPGETVMARSLATIVARMDPRTQIAEGQNAKIAVDAAELQFFDPDSGACLRA